MRGSTASIVKVPAGVLPVFGWTSIRRNEFVLIEVGSMGRVKATRISWLTKTLVTPQEIWPGLTTESLHCSEHWTIAIPPPPPPPPEPQPGARRAQRARETLVSETLASETTE